MYTPLSEVAPALVTDSAATGMQHMPVIRDFGIDGDGTLDMDGSVTDGGASSEGGDAGDAGDAGG